MAEHLERAAAGHALLAEPDLQRAEALRCSAETLVTSLREADGAGPSQRDDLLRRLVASGEITTGRISLSLDADALANALGATAEALSPLLLAIEAPLQMRRRGVELRLVAGTALPAPDPTLLRALARAHAWAAAIRGGETLASIARRAGCSESFIRNRVHLAFLAPRIQEAILAGQQPVDLTLERLLGTPLPLGWAEQERALGLVGEG